MDDFSLTDSVDDSRALIAPLLREPVERFALSNGLTVLLKPDTSSSVCSVQVWVKTGSIHEGRFLGSGISHFVEHMLFKGTERRPGKELSEIVQEAGGYINAYTTFDRTVYYIDIPSENVDVALDVLSDAVFASTFPAEEIDKEREVIMREIAMGEDDPDSKLSHAVFETVFRAHNYRYPIIGYKEVFARLSREDLLAYYRERYVPNNAVLVVTGDFEVAELRAKAEAWFGRYERKALAAVYLPEEPRQLAERGLSLYEDVQISRLAVGFQVPGLSHEDTPALDALSMALGNGDSSLLYQHLREDEQLVHSVDASNWTPGSVGVFYISMACEPDRREAALAELRSYLEGLGETDLTEQMVAKATRQLLANEVNSRKTVAGQASRLGAGEVVVGDIGYAKNYLSKVARLRAADLLRVLKKWLRSDLMTVVSMDPKESRAASAAAAEAMRSSLDFEELPQPNGSVLLLRRNHRLPNLHFRVVLQAGSLFEPPAKQGLTALLATMMAKDTATRSACEVAEAIEGVGGNFYEFSGNNSLGLALEVMPPDAGLALDLLEQALLFPAFDEEVFEHEKEAHLAAIKEQLDDIVAAGRKELRRRFFGEHPFAIGGGGSLDTVEGIELEEIRAFWRQMVVGGNVALAVSGDFDRAALQPRLEAFLAKVPSGALPVVDGRLERPADVGVHRLAMDRQQAIVYHAYPGPGLKEADYFVSEVADELFSGMSSVLFDRVREQLSLAYFVRSNRIVGLHCGMFYFYAGTSPERYQEVIVELDRETKRVASGGVSEEELRRCKNRLKASRRMSMQTNSSCASQAAMNVAYGLPANDWRRYDALIEAVTVEDLQRFAASYLAEEKRVELVVGPVAPAG